MRRPDSAHATRPGCERRAGTAAAYAIDRWSPAGPPQDAETADRPVADRRGLGSAAGRRHAGRELAAAGWGPRPAAYTLGGS